MIYIYLVVGLTLFWVAIGFLLLRGRPKAPDDSLALQLAADLGGTPPELVGPAPGRAWRFTLEHNGEHEVFVHGHGGRVRRLLATPVERGATILPAKLIGRSQEDYDFTRTLIPSADGAFEVAAGSPVELATWERRLDGALVERMQQLGVRWTRVELHWMETGRVESLDADWVVEAAEFLRELEDTIAG